MWATSWLLVPIALVAAMLGVVRRPPQVQVRLDGDHVVVALGAIDALLCLRGRVSVHRSQVVGVSAAARADIPSPGLRWPGTYWPGVVTAGTYGFGDARSFWDVRSADTVLRIECRPGSAYRRFVLQVPDPVARAAELQGVLGGSAD